MLKSIAPNNSDSRSRVEIGISSIARASNIIQASNLENTIQYLIHEFINLTHKAQSRNFFHLSFSCVALLSLSLYFFLGNFDRNQ